MNNLFEKIQELCKSKNITIAALERECGLGNATIKKWGTSIPSGDRLAKVADYFHVSVDYLLGREQTTAHSSFDNIDGVYLSYAKEAQDSGIDPDDIRLALETIKRLRGGK